MYTDTELPISFCIPQSTLYYYLGAGHLQIKMTCDSSNIFDYGPDNSNKIPFKEPFKLYV